MAENVNIESPGLTSTENPSARSIALNQELINALNQKGSADGEKPRDLLVIIKDLLSLEKNSSSPEDDQNKLKIRTENPKEKEEDKSDLFLKLMLALGGAVLIGASGGAGFALLAGGVGMLPVLPQLIEEGKKLFGMSDGQQNIAQNDSENLPKKMLAVSLLEIADSGKSEFADLIFSNESRFAEKIKSYTDSLSKMEQGQRDDELKSLREVVTNLASNQASTQPDLSKKIDGIFAGLRQVLEGKNLGNKEGEKEGERDILGELKNNLSFRGILNSDRSVTTAVSETQKERGDRVGAEASNGDAPSTAPASRGDDERPRAEPAQPKSQQPQPQP